MKQRIIGLDVGDKRVGVASCPVNSNIVSSIGVFERVNSLAEQKIIQLLNEGQFETMVVGLPLGADGKENEQCLKVRAFVRRIVRRLVNCSDNFEVVFVDEYASSAETYERLNSAQKRKRDLKHIDSYAACVILERYLEERIFINAK